MKIKIKSTMPICDTEGGDISVKVNDWYEIELIFDGDFTVETDFGEILN